MPIGGNVILRHRLCSDGATVRSCAGQMNVPAGTGSMTIPDVLGSIVDSVDVGAGSITKFRLLAYGGSAAPVAKLAAIGVIDRRRGGTAWISNDVSSRMRHIRGSVPKVNS